jgi:hypothetical protein
MTQAIANTNNGEIVEQVLILGDLGKLTAEQRAAYYLRTCESLGLNPITKPFDYITLNGKLTLYARKDCTDQLRSVRGVSMSKPDITFQDDLIIVTIEARDNTGRGDSDIGVVKKSDMQGNVANAIMKAVTKAKRRVTLSLCGLGMLDETEVETIPDALPFVEQPAARKPALTTAQPSPKRAPITQPPTNITISAANNAIAFCDSLAAGWEDNATVRGALRAYAADLGEDLTGLLPRAARDAVKAAAFAIVDASRGDVLTDEPMKQSEAVGASA